MRGEIREREKTFFDGSKKVFFLSRTLTFFQKNVLVSHPPRPLLRPKRRHRGVAAAVRFALDSPWSKEHPRTGNCALPVGGAGETAGFSHRYAPMPIRIVFVKVCKLKSQIYQAYFCRYVFAAVPLPGLKTAFAISYSPRQDRIQSESGRQVDLIPKTASFRADPGPERRSSAGLPDRRAKSGWRAVRPRRPFRRARDRP